MLGMICNFFKKHYNAMADRKNIQIINNYITAGRIFGSSVGDLGAIGQHSEFHKHLDIWEKAEKKYADLGYRTISINKFTKYGSYGTSIDDLLYIKRENDEEPIYHAEIYEMFFKDYMKTGFVQECFSSDKICSGEWYPPSTESKCIQDKWRENRKNK